MIDIKINNRKTNDIIFIKNKTFLKDNILIEILSRKNKVNILNLKTENSIKPYEYYYIDYNNFLKLKNSLFLKNHKKLIVFYDSPKSISICNNYLLNMFKIKEKEVKMEYFIKCLNLIKKFNRILYNFIINSEKTIKKENYGCYNNIVKSDILIKILE